MAWFIGFPREKRPWYPTINSENCLKYGIGMNCGKVDWYKKISSNASRI